MEQANIMSKTIEDFRNFFQNDKEKVKFNLKDLIIQDIELVKSSYSSENIQIQIENVLEDITLFGYKNELIQAILNILNNSKDQFIQLNTEPKVIKIVTQIQDNFVNIYIQDNAGGIDEDIIEKIFEPYFTTKHQSQGTGIGLYMTESIIINNMKGYIEVSNKEFIVNDKTYQGACFKISIPLITEIE